MERPLLAETELRVPRRHDAREVDINSGLPAIEN